MQELQIDVLLFRHGHRLALKSYVVRFLER